ncbi:MAG: hypothetical protein AAGA66_02025 [Bacteroidota bacterium]
MKHRINVVLLAIVFSPFVLTAQVRAEKDYERTFFAPEDARVEVISKYGEVIVQTWELDSIRFKILVKAEGKNSSTIRKSMDKVDVRFRKVGSMISAVTQVSSGNGFLSNIMNEVEGVVGSNNKLEVNYEVWVPENVDLSVENKFGDVFLADLKGRVNLNVSHGDIKASHIDQELVLTHSFGKSSFATLSDGSVTLRGVDMKIEKARRLDFESGSSEIFIDEADDVRFNSRNDEILISRVKDLSSRGSFTDLSVKYLERSASLNFSYGDIHFSQIDQDFSLMEITGKSTDIDLVLNQASFIKANIKGPEDRMILPNSMLLMNKEQLDEGIIKLTGEVGNTNTRYGQLTIEAEKGELIIAIKKTPIFTDRD